MRYNINFKSFDARYLVLGTCTCTRVQFEHKFLVLILVLHRGSPILD